MTLFVEFDIWDSSKERSGWNGYKTFCAMFLSRYPLSNKFYVWLPLVVYVPTKESKQPQQKSAQKQVKSSNATPKSAVDRYPSDNSLFANGANCPNY